MENKKFEQLIDLIINEQEDKARELFHEIVVEKSREIYESIMDEEMMGEEGDEMVGEVGDLMDEISAEESGDVVEAAEDEADIDFDDEAEEAGDDLTHDLESEHDEEGSVDKDDLGDIKDKLEDLMAEFESLMQGDTEEEEEEVVDVSEEAEEDMSEEEVMEAVQLQKVSVTHGDNGAQTKSTVAANSGAKGMDSKPVKFSGDNEAVPTGPKGPSNEYSKKEGDLPGAGKFKNVPGGKAKVDLAAAPKPVTSQASGVNNKSPVAKG
jgi:hypothetical protein